MIRKPIHRYLPLTYLPKIEGVIAGDITQSIRIDREETKRPLEVSDYVAFHGWTKGRYSPWSFRTPFCELIEVHPVSIRKDSIYFPEERLTLKADDPLLDKLASLDGIEPPTGRELIRVLHLMHGFGTLKGKVLRWDPEPIKQAVLVQGVQEVYRNEPLDEDAVPVEQVHATITEYQDFVQLGAFDKERATCEGIKDGFVLIREKQGVR